MKVGVGILAVLVLIVGGTCGGIYVWLQSNQERLREDGRVAQREGASFGSRKDAQVCVDEGLRRLEVDPAARGILGEARNKVFVESCLQTASVGPKLCEGVPPRDEIMQSAAWSLATCAALGKPDNQACTRLVGAVQQRCFDPRPQDARAP